CNERTILAQLDTGAFHTILSKRVAVELGIKFAPITEIQLAHQSTVCPEWKASKAVCLSCNGRTRLVRIRVRDRRVHTPMLFGRDLFLSLGITICNLPFATEDQVTPLIPVASEADYCPPRVFGSTPIYDEYRASAMAALKQASQNLQLPTQPGKVCFRQPYPLPEFVQSHVTKQIAKWPSAGIIAVTGGGSEWNSPLTYSFKKLSDGRKVDIRTCFDACGVNALLAFTDKHPLPIFKTRCLFEAPILHHYDPALPLFLACDGSNVAVGADLFKRPPTSTLQLLRCQPSKLKGGQKELFCYPARITGCHFRTLYLDYRPQGADVNAEASKPARDVVAMLRHYRILRLHRCALTAQNTLPDALSRLYPTPTTSRSAVFIQQLIAIAPEDALNPLT
ncbi:TPA: LOW QUALITY PROTEIN: hypothetical protein N0F65_003018, partial [Lagenidium giganteum]